MPVRVTLALILLGFAGAGTWFSTQLGLHGDETLFTNAILDAPVARTVEVGPWKLKTMVMGYVGSAKALLWVPVFRLFGYTVEAVRIPAVALGTLTVWLTFVLVRRVLGEWMGLIAAALLASDAIFLLTTTFDWGPVAVQHAATLGGLVLCARFVDRRRAGYLMGAFFLFGFALWHKALFAWTLAALGVAMLGWERGMLRAFLAPRALAAAVLGFLLGASPLIEYNISRRGATASEHASFDASDVEGKATLMMLTLKGTAAYGLFTSEEGPATPQPEGWMLWLVAASVAAALAGGGESRLTRVSLTVMVLMAALMWFQKDTGGSVHHSVLVYPAPQMAVACLVALGLKHTRLRWVVALVALAAIGQNARVVASYATEFSERGSHITWSTAQGGLLKALAAQRPEIVYVNDWGIGEWYRVLTVGKVKTDTGTGAFWNVPPDQVPDGEVVRRLVTPASVHVRYAGRTLLGAGIEKIEKVAAGQGLRRESLAVVRDTKGREVYEVYRYLK